MFSRNTRPLMIFAATGWMLLGLTLFTAANDGDGGGGGGKGGGGESGGSAGGIASPNCPADIAPSPGGNGVVNIDDLLFVINNWGACPPQCLVATDCNDNNPCTLDICVQGQCVHTPIEGCCQVDGNCPPRPNATSICVNNQCQLICDFGYADCDQSVVNGCETLLGTLSDCSGCGDSCFIPNASSACVAGICVFQGCNPGFADCNQNLVDGCETNLLADIHNCGNCGIVCSLPNATSTCVNGNCIITGCSFGYLNCDGLTANGCETNIGTDLNNCGQCGNVCSIPNAFSACVNGVCTFQGCNPGYSDCNQNLIDGCETFGACP